MSWTFDNNKPIYLQIMDKIKLQIVSHKLEPNQQLPTVRELASEAGVNPNTIQRALSDLEREGFVYTKRTAGRFVTEDLDLILQSRKQLSEEQLQLFVTGMVEFGYEKEELPTVLKHFQILCQILKMFQNSMEQALLLQMFPLKSQQERLLDSLVQMVPEKQP